MNIFGKFTIHRPSFNLLLIHRDPGLAFWLFMLIYCCFVVCLNSLFFLMIWETLLPRTLTCGKTSQSVTCEYVTRGFINKKTIEVQNVKKAIISRKENGETIVLTSSRPWVALEPTSNNIQNVQNINQGLDQLNNGDKVWKLDMEASASARQFIILLCLPTGLLLFLIGIGIIFGQGNAILEFDVEADTVSLLRLGKFRSQLSLFSQLIEAQTRPAGYLGILSEKIGIYGGDSYSRRRNHQILRLLFTSRRPFIFHQQNFARGEGQKLRVAINSFIAEHKR